MLTNDNNQNTNPLPSQMENPNPEAQNIEVATYHVFRATPPHSYEAFIYDNWLNSHRKYNDIWKLSDSRTYYEKYRELITQILSRPDCIIRVAVLSDDLDVALGWSVIERDCLHYVYVKPDCRKIGIAKALVPSVINSISHITSFGIPIWNKKLKQARFIPHI